MNIEQGGKLRGKAFYEKLYLKQVEWMSERGGDLAGYIAYYCGKFDRSVRYAKNVYNADSRELARIERLMS